jgi:hypothetical protein
MGTQGKPDPNKSSSDGDGELDPETVREPKPGKRSDE